MEFSKDDLVELSWLSRRADRADHGPLYRIDDVTAGAGGDVLKLAPAPTLPPSGAEGVAGAETLNLGTGAGYSVLDVVGAARRVTSRAIPTVARPRRPGDPPELVAAVGRAGRLLGWRPQRSGLDEILASAWSWHQTHPSGYPA